MPKKKTANATRKAPSTRKSVSHTDDHSFMIIVGGGFILLLLIGLLLMKRTTIVHVVAQKIPAMSENQKTQTVVIKDFAFSPETLTVKVGTTVTFENNDTVAHSAVSDNEVFDTKLLAPGEKGSYTFTKAGTYTYKCGVHPSMMGKIVVEE
ncbi:hypothetical protein BH09PAT1_BH09PAT1_8040 [soil metagenome]